MAESKLFPIRPLPRNVIAPLPRDFTPSMYKNSKIFIMNPVFNVIIENERPPELEMCIICLENIIEPERIKPCEICNTHMHEKCFIEYSKSKQNKPTCVTCYKEINLNDIDIEIEEEKKEEEETDEERTNRLREERIYRCKKIKKRVYAIGCSCLCLGVLILIIIAMQKDYDRSNHNDYDYGYDYGYGYDYYYERSGYYRP